MSYQRIEAKVITRYSCDRCGMTHEEEGAHRIPEKWKRVTVSSTPMQMYDLCFRCIDEFIDLFLENRRFD